MAGYWHKQRRVGELVAGSESMFAYHPVSKAVKNARNNNSGLIAMPEEGIDREVIVDEFAGLLFRYIYDSEIK